jgi:diadenylate cyclase
MDLIALFFSELRWQDLLDIAINSYVLFRFYILFRGTNVLRVLFALACVWFAQRITFSMGLIVSSWISQGVTAAAALIVVVIFRNEIRGVLQSKNIKGILWDIPRKSVRTPVDVIVDAVFEMARKRIGALLVFPGKEELEEIIQHGIPWQGIVSREMILSIFFPDNPVHDGAAVIRAEQVEEVGCILPLSRREDLPTVYGTRHRAALGLAEQTDALVVIVSEERGAVSVARKSQIRIVDRKTLENRLKEHTGLRMKSAEGIFSEKMEIVAAAVFSAVLISGIWFSIARGLDTLAAFEVPVEYMNRNPSREIVEASTNKVTLQLGGSRSLLNTIHADQLAVRVDLSSAALGSNTFSITRDNITLPPGLILKDVDPSLVEVTLDILTERSVPVQADWVGKLDPTLILADVRLTPDRVTVIGGSRLLETLHTLYTEKIPVEPITASGSMTVKLAINPAKLKIAPDSPGSVTVDYVVNKRNPQDGRGTP